MYLGKWRRLAVLIAIMLPMQKTEHTTVKGLMSRQLAGTFHSSAASEDFARWRIPSRYFTCRPAADPREVRSGEDALGPQH
eukprot:721117-Prorocentrum_minimum.AAC.1